MRGRGVITRVEALISRGRYGEALAELHAARRAGQLGADDPRFDLAIGRALARRGELDRAEPHLARSLARARDQRDARAEAAAESELGEVYRLRGELDRAADAFASIRDRLGSAADTDAIARALAGLAAIACTRGQTTRGLSLAAEAVAAAANASPAVRVAVLLVLARCRRGAEDLVGAERAGRDAIELASGASLPRELAEAYLAYAYLAGESGHTLARVALDSPASLLVRAQELFREHGSITDLERIREAFQRFGRRATDRAVANPIRSVIEELRRARIEIGREVHRVVDAALSGHDVTDHAATAERVIGGHLETMSAAEGRAVTAVQTIISERESIRILLDLIRALNQLDDYQRMVEESCRMAAQLTNAERGLLAIWRPSGVLEVRANVHMPALDSETGWRRAVEQMLETRGPLLIESDLATSRGDDQLQLGTALVAPLRHGNQIFGAIYVDNAPSSGVFTSRDLDLLALFSAQVATMLQNVRTAEELRIAARSRAATLEAISDGVLWLDRAGVVTSINAVAAGLLGVAPNATPNLALFPGLAFLQAVLERGEPVDDRVTRIGAQEVVANARAVRGDDREIAGAVVTLTGMKRAKSIAQRIAGSPARYSFRDLIGQAPSLKDRLRVAEAAARSDSNVLITGESGTGKEILAQAIHNASPRAAGPFVGINCSAIPRELLESELFGYEGGAFTGARRTGQPGKFELAEGGTILLDEIGDMPLDMQAKLLRVLQERRVRRIGAPREVVLDARVIATTHHDLDATAAHGRFRADLLFRLKVIHIEVPPLRERTGDVPLLVEHYLRLFTARLGKQVRGVSPEVMEALQRYAWPGNIRELENVLESEVSLIDPDQTVLDRIPDALARSSARVLPRPGSRTLEEAERELLVEALSRHAGFIPDVARSLGVSRATVYNKLHVYGIDPRKFRNRS
jgi:sigma-54 dependent transcriptional regulator, acetoin dehydrogenase operon transcriptional activator AcoR